MGWLKTTLKIMVESLLWTATCIATLLAAITLWLQFSTLSLVPIAGAIENMLEARIGGKIHLLNPRLGWSQTSNDFTFALDRIYYVDDVLGVKMLADNIFAKHNMDAVLENGVWSAASIFRIEGVHIYGENGTVLRSQITEALFALSALEGDGLRYIDDFTISNINFIQADIDGESEPSHLILRRTGDTLTANGKIAFPAHDGYKPTLMMAGRIGVGVGGQIAINISDASTSAIADWGQGLALLKVVEARGNVSAIVRINADLRPTTGEFDMNLGAGQVHLPFTPPSFIPEKMTLHKAHLVMDVDFATEVLRMSVGKVSLDKSELDLQGRFTYAQDNVGGLSVRGQITNGTAHLDMADILTAPLQLRDVKADATYDYANTIFRIDHLSANDERNRRIATLVGELAVKPHKQSTLQVDLDIGAIDGENIMDRWSPLLAGNTRKWARENLSGGRLVGAHLKMNVLLNTLITKPRRAPLPEGAVHLQMYFEDMRLNYIDDMPPLQEATGKIDVYGKTMFVALKSGKVILQNNKDPIIIGASTLFMDDYRDPDRNSILEIGLKGQSKTIMRYINLPPVFATRNVDFDFSRLEGDMAGRVKMYLPIKPDIDRDAIRFTASAQSTNAAITGKIDDYTISAGQVYTTIDNQYFSMQGNIEANGVPLTLAWHLPVALPEKSQLALSGAIDKADMIALEQGDWASHINENAWLNLLVEGLMTAPDHYRFDIDLTDTEFIPRPLAYKKAVGVAASLKGRVNLAPNQDWQKLIFRYDDEVTTPINGILTFTDRKLESLTLPPITMGQTRDLLIKFAKNKEYRRLDITAKRLHIDPPFSEEGGIGLSYGDDGFNYLGDAFSIGLAVDTLQSGLELLGDASVQAQHRNGHYEEITSHGRFHNGAQMSINLTRISPDERQLFVQSENAGSFFRLTGLTSSVDGGALVTDNVIIHNSFRNRASNNLRMSGGMNIYNINVHDLPLLARTASLAALSGVPAALRGDGIPFRKGSFSFRLVGDILTIENGLFKGSIGITTRGDYNVESQAMNIGGSLIPFYRINSAFGKVPLLGRLVGDNGLVGFSYQITGNARDPDVNVNPLSGLALGRLREVIDNDADLLPSGTPSGTPIN